MKQDDQVSLKSLVRLQRLHILRLKTDVKIPTELPDHPDVTAQGLKMDAEVPSEVPGETT